MIDYEEELKKFEPCLDVTDAESAIYDRETYGYSGYFAGDAAGI